MNERVEILPFPPPSPVLLEMLALLEDAKREIYAVTGCVTPLANKATDVPIGDVVRAQARKLEARVRSVDID